MQGIWRRLFLMALLIPVGWRNESLAQTTSLTSPKKIRLIGQRAFLRFS